MAMFEHDKSLKKRAEHVRQDNDEQATLRQGLTVLEKRVHDLEQRVDGHANTLNALDPPIEDLRTRFGQYVSCPQCGLVSDVQKVPVSGGFFRDKAKRCRFCEHHDEGPIFPTEDQQEA